MTRAELSDMIDLAGRLASVNEPAVVATLFSSDGSTYRRLGSMMVSGPAGMIAGGVSGGCLEEYIARHGRELIKRQSATILSFDADPDAEDTGKPVLGCGGSIEVLVERCTPDHIAFLREFAVAQISDVYSTAAVIVDTSHPSALSVRRNWLYHPDKPLPPKLILPWEKGGLTFVDNEGDVDFRSPIGRVHRRAMDAEESRHGILDSSRRALIHFVPPMTRLVILGAGNDVRPLAASARSLGWHVTVADRRGRLATQSRFPEADRVIAGDWASAVSQIAFTPQTAVVLMTHSLKDDIEILPLLADKPVAYVGSLGPEHRREWVVEGATKTAVISDSFLACFRGPIGLNLGDRTAAGIAVSIIAEILAELNGRDATSLSAARRRQSTRAANRVTHA